MLYLEMIEACHSPACLDQVNGLYGPGAMLGWYLTLAGCIISWTLHPHRKSKDSIHPDFVAFLVVPLTAAAQIVSLSRHAQDVSTTIESADGAVLEAALLRDLASLQTCQVRAAIEAATKIINVYLFITIMLYPLPALCHAKRGSALAFVFIVCFASQIYAPDFTIINIPALFKASNFLSRTPRFQSCTATVIGQDVCKWIVHGWKRRGRITDPGVVESQSSQKQEPLALMDGRIAMVVVCGIVTLIQRAKGWSYRNTLFALPPDLRSIVFPESPHALRNIEQIVAAGTGAVVLGFNLYHAGKLLYKERSERLLLEETSQTGPRTSERPERRWHGHRDKADDECSYELQEGNGKRKRSHN